MRIIQLTPGTGTFLCGSCLRDNTLVKALCELGHEAMIAPLYLPFSLEGADAQEHSADVHMGGINVFLQQVLPGYRFLPRFLRDRLDSPRLLRFAAGRSKMTEAPGLGPLTLSMLRGEAGRQRTQLDELVQWLKELPRPDVVILSNVMLIGLAREIGKALECPVLCTLQGEAPFLDNLAEPYRQQCWDTLKERAKDVAAFLPVSEYTAELMGERLGLAPERRPVVWNGIELDDFPEPAPAPAERPPTVGFLARMCSDKGIDQLLESFMIVNKRLPEARLVAAGVVLNEDKALLKRLRGRVREAGLEAQVDLRGPVSREAKLALLREVDVLSVPATYGESFGLYLLEAWASGTPVVQPDCGAFPELLEATGGGLLYPPGDSRQHAACLLDLLQDRERAQALGLAARKVVFERFDAASMGRAVEQVCRLRS
ncbi:MAG: glycosyltransferase involved in cell wall biosynthesis [Planctomycetota bacterium]